jgi:hypothetical protein
MQVTIRMEFLMINFSENKGNLYFIALIKI